MVDLLNTVAFSDKRRNLLLLLLEGPRTMGDIRRTLNVTAAGMHPQIKILMEKGLVEQRGKEYALTGMGHAIAGQLSRLMKMLDTFEKHGKFWQEHDMEAIPPELLLRIGELGNSRIIERGIEESYDPHKEVLENIAKSRKIAGISPIVPPVYPEFLSGLAEKGVDISLVVSRNVFNKLEKDYSKLLERVLNFKNISIYLSDEDIRFALIAADNILAISLFFKNGASDSRRNLISFDSSALLWGEELFNYYKERSVRVEKL